MEPLLWPIVLLLLALLFVGLELFVPSGGVLSFLAGASVLASVYVGFLQGPVYGLISFGLSLVAVPAALAAALHYWPKTPIGRRIFLNAQKSEPVLDVDQQQRLQLVGKHGMAKSLMLPSGAIVVEGRTYDAVSRGNPIEAGQPIRVVAVQGNHIVVAPAEAHQGVLSSEPEVLSQPLDQFGIDPFDEPLA